MGSKYKVSDGKPADKDNTLYLRLILSIESEEWALIEP